MKGTRPLDNDEIVVFKLQATVIKDHYEENI